MKAIVTGMIATYPVGGVAWDYCQYAAGFGGGDFLAQSLQAFSPTLAHRWHYRSPDDTTYGLSDADVADIEANYAHHKRGAREMAETYFDARYVLGRLLADIGL